MGGLTLRAVLLDAMRTLVALEPPAPRLRAALAARGAVVALADAERAMAAEIRLYVAEHGAAGTRPALEALRDRCAAVVEEELRTGLPAAAVRAALLEAVRFAPYPEVPEALGELRALGLRLVVCSNWDVSLHEVLATTGLAERLDGAVASAELGEAKPAPAAFAAALGLAGVAAGEALHAGDDFEADVAGARVAGVEPVFGRRGAPAPAGVTAVDDLAGLVALARRRLA